MSVTRRFHAVQPPTESIISAPKFRTVFVAESEVPNGAAVSKKALFTHRGRPRSEANRSTAQAG
jgi:hypothetical protein